MTTAVHLPFDSEARDARLFRKNVPAYLLDHWFCRGIGDEGLVRVFVVDVVTDTDEFTVVVRAAEEHHCNTNDLGVWNFGQVRGIRLEDEFVDTDWDGTD